MHTQRRPTQVDQGRSGPRGSVAGTRSRPRNAGDNSEELLSQYFRDIAPIGVLGAAQEEVSARRIEETTVAAWEHLLGPPEYVEAVLDKTARCLGLSLDDEPDALALRRAARSILARGSAKPGRAYSRALRRAALRLRELDSDSAALLMAVDDVESQVVSRGSLAAGSNCRDDDERIGFAQTARRLAQQAIDQRNAFVSANLRLVIKIAKRYRSGSMPLVDLIQEGNLGLLEAVKRFDYRRGFRFSTYASWWIRHAICRAIADRGQLVRVPLHLAETRRRIGKARSALGNRNGEVASAEAVASETGIDVEKVKSADAELLPLEVRLDQEVSEGLRYLDMIPDPQASLPLDEVVLRDAGSKVLELIDDLEPVEAEIIRRRFGIDGREPQTLREIARHYKLSRERIRQIEIKGLGTIRKRLLRRPIRSATRPSATNLPVAALAGC
jgi:RNA polymerase primary sigma factor